ncbi:MAG: hypothetical protein JWP82_1974 [Humibacillus sp.]|nr:hypothetical protein [Humibacillus sp.]
MSVDERPMGPARILGWLRAGYPHGIPAQDYLPLLGVLHRRLTDEDITAIAADLASQAAATDARVTEADVRRMVSEHAFQSARPDDVTRVSSVLAGGGWPLAGDPDEQDRTAS